MFVFHELKFEFGTSYRVTSCIPKPIDRYDYEYEKQKKVKFIGCLNVKKLARETTEE